MESWIITFAVGTAGYIFLAPVITGIVAKVFPAPSAGISKVLAGAIPAAAVIVALYFGRKFFGGKEV